MQCQETINESLFWLELKCSKTWLKNKQHSDKKKTLLSSSLTKTPARRLSFGQYRGSELKLDLDLRIGQTKNVKVLVFMLTWKLFYLPVVWFYQQISFFEMKNRSCLNKGLSFASIFVKKKIFVSIQKFINKLPFQLFASN
jgi:hypothetical protein